MERSGFHDTYHLWAMHHCVFLDESGAFSLKQSDSFIGGWICRADDVADAFQAAAPALDALRDLNPREGGIVHLLEISRTWAHAPHRWEKAYRRLFEALDPYISSLVRADAPRLQMIGPTEAWHGTLLRLILGVLAQAEPNYTYEFHVSQRLKPIEAWLDFYKDADRYHNRLKDWLVDEIRENSGRDFPRHHIRFLPSPQSSVRGSWERTAQELADTCCSAQSRSFGRILPAWPSSRLLHIRSTWKIRSERRILEDAVRIGNGLGQILYSLIESGSWEDPLAASIPDRMDESDWSVLCELVQTGLLADLTTDDARNLRSHELSAIVEAIPSTHAAAPARLLYLTELCRLRIVALEGGWDGALLERLEAFIQDRSATPFLTDLERAQARIDLAILGFQLEQVNLLRPDPSAPKLRSALAWYRSAFPDASKDRNLAALHGSIGQALALFATPGQLDRDRNLARAMKHFHLDEAHAPTPWDESLALGFQIATAFQQQELDAMTELHVRECAALDLGWNGPGRPLPWTPDTVLRHPFCALHHAQWHALRNRTLPRPSTDSTHLVAAWAVIGTETRSTYPLLLLGKWIAFLVHQDGDTPNARLAISHLDVDAPERIWRATDWMQLVITVMDREMERPDSGFDWLTWWSSLPENRTEQRIIQWLISSRTAPTQGEVLWALARALPFNYS